MDQSSELALQKITGSLHAAHGILEEILLGMIPDDDDRAVSRIGQRFNFDGKSDDDDDDGLKSLASQARNLHELAKELRALVEMQRKEKSRMESRVSSLVKENQDIHNILKVAIAEKEVAENSLLRVLKFGDDTQQGGRSAILQIAERGLHKVGLGFIMEVVSGEPTMIDDIRRGTSNATSASGEQEVVSLASIVENTVKTLHQHTNDLTQTLEESRSDCQHFQLLATDRAQKMMRYESHIKDLEARERFLAQNVEELTLRTNAVEQEALRWRKACEMEVEAGKFAIKELNQEITLLRDELGRVKADLKAADSKLQLKEKLATSAMAAQAAAEACLKLADSRSAGLQQKIEELTRQIEQEDPKGRKKEGESTRRKLRYVCWPWQVISASSRARTRTWFVDQNGRLLPGTEAILQARI